jgi:hypothetical protein
MLQSERYLGRNVIIQNRMYREIKSRLNSVQICFWTLSIILFLSKITVMFIFQNSVLETGFYLWFLVKPTQLDPISRASRYLWTPIPAGVYKPSTAQPTCET